MGSKGTVFFDYDGTLHDCMRLYGPAFRKAYALLVDQGLAEPREFSDAWISRWLGWTVRDMWQTFMPSLSEEQWRPASRLVGEEMDRLLEAGAGALFDGVPAMLDALCAEGYELVLLSNCATGYRDRHRGVFGLDQWFSAYYCAGDHPGLAKWEIYQRVACKRHVQPHVMVGDRFHDIEVATRANIASVGCAYGFGEPGELRRASMVVDAPAAILEAVSSLVG